MDFRNNKLTIIKKTNSSWNVWKGIDMGNGKHFIEIKPTEIIEHQF